MASDCDCGGGPGGAVAVSASAMAMASAMDPVFPPSPDRFCLGFHTHTQLVRTCGLSLSLYFFLSHQLNGEVDLPSTAEQGCDGAILDRFRNVTTEG